jgi:hypothetical protein
MVIDIICKEGFTDWLHYSCFADSGFIHKLG